MPTEPAESSQDRQMAFDCSCGKINYLYGEPEDFEGRIFECEGCGTNTLLGNHHEEKPE